jgi:hypothetical protein
VAILEAALVTPGGVSQQLEQLQLENEAIERRLREGTEIY